MRKIGDIVGNLTVFSPTQYVRIPEMVVLIREIELCRTVLVGGRENSIDPLNSREKQMTSNIHVKLLYLVCVLYHYVC